MPTACILHGKTTARISYCVLLIQKVPTDAIIVLFFN